MAGESLGSATLDLDVQLAPLYRGLAAGEKRVAQSVAVMQAMLDSLHADVAVRVSETGAVADRLAASAASAPSAGPVAVGPASSAPTQNQMDRQTLYGVRGPERSGSTQNPIVAVLEAAKYTPMGSYAAQIGESSAGASSRADQTSGLPTSDDIAALTASITDMAQSASPPAQLAQAGDQGLAQPTLARERPTVVSLDDPTAQALRQTAETLSRIESSARQSATRTVLTPVPARTGAPASDTATRTVPVPVPERAASAPRVSDTTINAPETTIEQRSPSSSASADAYQAALLKQAQAEVTRRGAMAGYQQTLRAPASTPEEIAAALSQREAAVAQANAAREESKAAQAAMAAQAAAGGSGGRSGQGGGPPVAAGGGGGGGGGRFSWSPFGGARFNPDSGKPGPFSASNLLTAGGGALGLPAFGSVGSLAGLSLEHFLLTGAGLGVSAATGLAGGGLLAAAGATTSAVGGGADALVNKTASTNVKTLYGDMNNLNRAIAVYGANSRQASVAQKTLNYDMSEAGPSAKAELAVANQLSNLTNNVWPQVSAGAQKVSDKIFSQVLDLATQYAPRVADAAKRNLTIVNTGLHPLFTWLEGPTGVGIFNTLENKFAKDLPTAIHAFDQGVEFFLREMSIASQYTGGFMTWLDKLFTRLNAKPNSTLNTWTEKLVDDFQMWKNLVRLLGIDLYDLFKADAGTSQAIVLDLTQMLEKLHEWETSTQGHAQLHTFFDASKTEILALLSVLPPLVKSFASFYLTVAPPLHLATAGLVTVFANLATALESLGPGVTTLLGLGIVAAKLGVLAPALTGAARAMGLMSAAEQANTVAAAGDAAATAGLAGSEKLVVDAETGMLVKAPEASLLSRLNPSSILSSLGRKGATLGGASAAQAAAGELSGTAALGAAVLPAAAAGGVGILGGSIVQHAAGLRSGTAGTLGGGVGGAAAGAGIGTLIAPGLGTAIGALIGGGIGSSLGPSILHLFAGTDTGKKIADSVVGGFGPQFKKSLAGQNLAGEIAKELDQANQLMGKRYVPTTHGGLGSVALGPSATSIAKANQQYELAGRQLAGHLEAGWNQYKQQSEPIMFQQFRAEAGKLPPVAQAAAAQSAIAFAQRLEAQGRLPAGAAAKMISQIEAQFPALTKYMGVSAHAGVGEFTRQLDLQAAEQKLKRQLGTMSGDFPQVTAAMNKTAGDAQTKAQAMITALQAIPTKGSAKARELVSADLLKIAGALKDTQGRTADSTAAMVSALQNVAAHGTKPMRAQATSDLNALRSTTVSSLQKMADSTISQTGAMQSAAASNFHHMQSGTVASMSQIVSATQGGMSKFAAAVQAAMANGTLSTGKGMQLIITNLNKALKEMGQKQLSQIQVETLSGSVTNAATLAAGQTPAGGFRATGGLIQVGRQGERGHDTVPVNVGGTDIIVGDGEQVAVLNHDQQALLNTRLSDLGGLGGMFAKVNRPHYMASGGIVPTPRAFAGGGTLSYAQLEGLWEQAGGSQASAPVAAAIAEAESGGQAVMQQGQPFATTGWGYWQITPGGPQYLDAMTNARMAVSDWKSRGFEPWTTFNDGAYRQYLHGNVPASAYAGGGGGSTWTPLTAPGVKGTGAIADIAQGAIKQANDAANTYGAAHTPAPTTGSGGGGGFSFQSFTGGLPVAVQKAIQVAKTVAARREPYVYGGGHGADAINATGLDCSGYVSLILDEAGLLGGPVDTTGLKSWGLPGDGKYITVGVWGSSGMDAHTMIELANTYWESGGGPLGPHQDQGWSQSFPIRRHPPGLASGGLVGDFGRVAPSVLLKNDPGIGSVPGFAAYARAHGLTPNQAKAGGGRDGQRWAAPGVRGGRHPEGHAGVQAVPARAGVHRRRPARAQGGQAPGAQAAGAGRRARHRVRRAAAPPGPARWRRGHRDRLAGHAVCGRRRAAAVRHRRPGADRPGHRHRAGPGLRGSGDGRDHRRAGHRGCRDHGQQHLVVLQPVVRRPVPDPELLLDRRPHRLRDLHRPPGQSDRALHQPAHQPGRLPAGPDDRLAVAMGRRRQGRPVDL